MDQVKKIAQRLKIPFIVAYPEKKFFKQENIRQVHDTPYSRFVFVFRIFRYLRAVDMGIVNALNRPLSIYRSTACTASLIPVRLVRTVSAIHAPLNSLARALPLLSNDYCGLQ